MRYPMIPLISWIQKAAWSQSRILICDKIMEMVSMIYRDNKLMIRLIVMLIMILSSIMTIRSIILTNNIERMLLIWNISYYYVINSYVINTTSNIFTTTDYNHHHETEDPDRLPDGKQPAMPRKIQRESRFDRRCVASWMSSSQCWEPMGKNTLRDEKMQRKCWEKVKAKKNDEKHGGNTQQTWWEMVVGNAGKWWLDGHDGDMPWIGKPKKMLRKIGPSQYPIVQLIPPPIDPDICDVKISQILCESPNILVKIPF